RFGSLGLPGVVRRLEEFMVFLTRVRNDRRKDNVELEAETEGGVQEKILDTGAIIDGRSAAVIQTHLLEGTIVIPQFVPGELQHIADSSDALKRNRGRRGLDILNRIQKELDIAVEIYEGDFEDTPEVDSKLVKLAKKMDGIVVTNDFN